MAEAIVSFVVENIGNLLINEAKQLYQVRGEVDDLLTELRLMRHFLKDADARQAEEETIRSLVADIREVAYDVENVIETYAVKLAIRRKQRSLNILWKPIYHLFNGSKARYMIGSEIKNLQTRMTRIKTSLLCFGVVFSRQGVSRQGEGLASTLLRSYSHVVDKDFVGFEKDVETLVAKVVSDTKYHRVIAICGMGGLGKTTLARKIYRHRDVRSRFDAFAWVSISQQWQPRDVLQRIIRGLVSNKDDLFEKMIDEQLVKYLHTLQQEKRCLVVLDDIWSLEAWKDLSAAFPNDNTSSQIMLTTRNKNVALSMDRHCFLHDLQCLNEEQGWRLLQKKAFLDDDTDLKVDGKMEELGREMVSQCGGLPLAIVVLGGILSTRNTLAQWQEVRHNVNSYLKKGKGIGGEESRVMEVLALSYQDLPYQLKACYLYVGSYPEDFDIEVEKLYQLWMAEGFIPASLQAEGREEETMMDVAERYLDELARRCMVQVELKPEECTLPSRRRRYQSCRIHDLLRDLCLSKMEEENFLQVIDKHRKRQVDSSSSSSFMRSSNSNHHKTRRYAIYLDTDTIEAFDFQELENTQAMRSLLFFEAPFRGVTVTHFGKKFKRLRVLDLSNCGFRKDWRMRRRLPKEIGNLVLLRYLGLRKSFFKKLPASICNLRFLQTLDLRTWHLCNVPNVLWKMEGLMHLYLPKFYVNILRIDGLRNLQTLDNFQASYGGVKDLSKLTNLRRLENVRMYEYLEDLEAINNYLESSSSKRLQHTSIELWNCDLPSEKGLSLLRELFKCDVLGKLSIHGTIGKLPEYDNSCCQSLHSLCLTGTKLNEDSMTTLEKLPNLRSLDLESEAFRGKHMVFSTLGFLRLNSLSLRFMMDLEDWTVNKGAMPNLSMLQIFECKNLKMLPDGLRFITNLRELHLRDMSQAFKNRLQVVDGIEGEDLHKFHHIPIMW